MQFCFRAQCTKHPVLKTGCHQPVIRSFTRMARWVLWSRGGQQPHSCPSLSNLLLLLMLRPVILWCIQPSFPSSWAITSILIIGLFFSFILPWSPVGTCNFCFSFDEMKVTGDPCGSAVPITVTQAEYLESRYYWVGGWCRGRDNWTRKGAVHFLPYMSHFVPSERTHGGAP